MAMPVVYHPQYEVEWRSLPPAGRAALASAAEKLRADSQLGFPHTSRVQGSKAALRELRPRRGRSPWRAPYRRVGGVVIVLAVAPEAERDRRGFDRAVAEAERRLRDVEE
jgi:hypothetical protein